LANKKMQIDIHAKDKTKAGVASADKSVKGLSATVGKLGTLLAGLGAGLALVKIARDFVAINREFQRLNASLITVTGSTDAANAAFKNLEDFATRTPYQLTQVVDSFIKLKAMGLDPSNAALESYGNTASAMGKDLNMMIEAVADAATGEFERLKEFGIKAKSEGDNVTFLFRGVATTVKKEASAMKDTSANSATLNLLAAWRGKWTHWVVLFQTSRTPMTHCFAKWGKIPDYLTSLPPPLRGCPGRYRTLILSLR